MPIEFVRIKKSSSAPIDSNPESTSSDAIAEQPTEAQPKKSTKGKKKTHKTDISLPAETTDNTSVESVEKEQSLAQVDSPSSEIISQQPTDDQPKKTTKSKKKAKKTEVPVSADIIEGVAVESFVEKQPPVEPSSEAQTTPATKKKKKKATADSSQSDDLATNSTPTNPLEPGAYFQAIGAVFGKLVQQGTRYCLQIGEQTFPLNISNKKSNQIVDTEQEIYFKVYPYWFVSFKDKKEQHRLGFRVMGSSTKPFKNFQANHFILRGVWQKSPVTGEPQLTVYRNQSHGSWDKCKPLHIPLVWENAPIEPFFYDPNLTKEERAKRYFCQLETVFDAESQTFKVIRQLDEPTTQIPPYIKRQQFSKNSPVEQQSEEE